MFFGGRKKKGQKKNRKMETRSGVFAVAITVLLLMALTMNSVSAESKAKVNLGPTDADKMKLNHSDAGRVNLDHTNVARAELNHSDAGRVNLDHTNVAREELNHSDAAKVALNPSESMTFPTERTLNELIYDDGTAENAYTWSSGGNGFAVQFTPQTYPVVLRTAMICFWPDLPDLDHEEFAVYVYDDDGPGGEPGTCLGGPIYHMATAWGWCGVDISGLGITIENGDFYILYKQLTDDPDCEGLCVDQSLPQYERSWDYVGGIWDLFDEENYMIRCVVDGDATDEWTYMVYLDGDNNLEGAGIDDFMEMSSVGSTSEVNIVVQFDRIPGYDTSYGDWTTCKRFHVTAGMTPTAANAISDLDECNMGDPNTLRDFVEWAMTEFPADNYALVLWNHGDGWKSINEWVPWADDLKDAKDAGLSRGICVDITDNDYLSLQETEVALTGKYVQLLGYDACLMHMIEVVYQVMANAGVSVGSEELEPGDGWPYDTILTDLTVTPTMNEDALGTVIVDRYMASYPTRNDLTQSAMDNYALPNLVTAVDNLAQALINEINGGHVAEVQQARNAAEEIYYTYYIDLYHFAEMVDTHVTGATAQAQAVMNEVSGSMYEAHGTSVPNDHGLSIYYPRVEGDYLASYDSTAFASDTQWNEFLKKYYNPSTQGDDIAVFRDGLWQVSTDGNPGTINMWFWYGASGQTPVVGDIDQDGKDDIAVYNNGLWQVSTDGNPGTINMWFWYGALGQTPVVGDIDQDGQDDIATYNNGLWQVSTDGNPGTINMWFWYGASGQTPVVGDIDQDGQDDIATYTNGLWQVSTDGNPGTINMWFWYGAPGETPVVGDINQDGTDDIETYNNGLWQVSTDGNPGTINMWFWYGASGQTPVAGNMG